MIVDKHSPTALFALALFVLYLFVRPRVKRETYPDDLFI